MDQFGRSRMVRLQLGMRASIVIRNTITDGRDIIVNAANSIIIV